VLGHENWVNVRIPEASNQQAETELFFFLPPIYVFHLSFFFFGLLESYLQACVESPSTSSQSLKLIRYTTTESLLLSFCTE